MNASIISQGAVLVNTPKKCIAFIGHSNTLYFRPSQSYTKKCFAPFWDIFQAPRMALVIDQGGQKDKLLYS